MIAGMMSAFDGGIDFEPGPTGVTRLTETDFDEIVMPFDCTVSVPVFAPGGRLLGFAVTLTVVPPGGMVPDEGDTVRNDLSVAAVNVTSSAVFPIGASMWIGIVIGVVLPKGTTPSADRPVAGGSTCTTIVTKVEFGPTAPPQLLART